MLANLQPFLSPNSQSFYMAQANTESGVFVMGNFSSPQFLVALLSGLMMTFAFQLLLTNLSLALIASPGVLPDSDHESDGLISTLRGIETKIGIGALVTVSIALFTACFLAVKLSLVNSTLLGAIIGIVIWSTYFSVTIWLGSNAVGSLIGSIMNTAASGLQGIIGTTTKALGATTAKEQAVSTAEEITAAVRRELTAGLDVSSIQQTLQSSLGNLQLPKLDIDKIGSQFEKLVQESELKDITDSDLLRNIDRQSFVDLVSNRTDFSKKDINQIADRLESTWKQLVGDGEQKDAPSQIRELLQSAAPADLNSDKLAGKLQQLIKGSDRKDSNDHTFVSQALQFGLSALFSKVVQNTELSDLDIADQVASTFQSLTEQLQKVQHTFQTAISSLFDKVRSYLDSLERPELSYEGIQQDFRKVFDDPQAGFEALGDRLNHFDRETLVAVLSSREDISEADAKRIIEKIEETKDNVTGQAQQIQKEVQKRFQVIKQQAQQQAIETQKVAASAAWWLFGTALTSLAASAIAGMVAVSG